MYYWCCIHFLTYSKQPQSWPPNNTNSQQYRKKKTAFQTNVISTSKEVW